MDGKKPYQPDKNHRDFPADRASGISQTEGYLSIKIDIHPLSWRVSSDFTACCQFRCYHKDNLLHPIYIIFTHSIFIPLKGQSLQRLGYVAKYFAHRVVNAYSMKTWSSTS